MSDKWHQLATDRLAEIGRLKEALAAEGIAHTQTIANFQAMGLGFIEERRSYESRLSSEQAEVEKWKAAYNAANDGQIAAESGLADSEQKRDGLTLEWRAAMEEIAALQGRLEQRREALDAIVVERDAYAARAIAAEQLAESISQEWRDDREATKAERNAALKQRDEWKAYADNGLLSYAEQSKEVASLAERLAAEQLRFTQRCSELKAERNSALLRLDGGIKTLEEWKRANPDEWDRTEQMLLDQLRGSAGADRCAAPISAQHHAACVVSVTGGLEGPCDCGAVVEKPVSKC